MRICIVDDNALIRSSLRMLLERRPDWVVVGEAANGRDAVKTCLSLQPDLTVMDFHMPEMDGLEAARQLTRDEPEAPILMVTVDPSRQLEVEAAKAGIKGVCPKAQVGCVVDAIETLLNGKTYFPLGWAVA